MRPNLRLLFENHRGNATDKWSSYIELYQQRFAMFRARSINLLEIGVQNGGSLEVWADYFHNAKRIVGCDIDERCASLAFRDPRISVVVGDGRSELTKRNILRIAERFDIVIDDGSHLPGDIIRSFLLYFSALEDGGLYIIEDLQCSYWNEFEGGLFSPRSSLSFLKRLVDALNGEHWGVEGRRSDIFRSFEKAYNVNFSDSDVSEIRSIEFANSICIITKGPPNESVLGSRIVSGTTAVVAPEIFKVNRNKLQFDQTLNPWSNTTLLPEEESAGTRARLAETELGLREAIRERDAAFTERDAAFAERSSVVAERNAAVAERNAAVAERNAAVAERNVLGDSMQSLLNSRSWQMTRALRVLVRHMKRVRSYLRSVAARRIAFLTGFMARLSKGKSMSPDATHGSSPLKNKAMPDIRDIPLSMSKDFGSMWEGEYHLLTNCVSTNAIQTVICGHSHSIMLGQAILANADSPGSPDFEVIDSLCLAGLFPVHVTNVKQYWDLVEKLAEIKNVAIVWGGNDHNANFLLLAGQPFDFIPRNYGSVLTEPDAVLVAETLVREHFRPALSELDGLLKRLAKGTRRRLVIGTPAPLRDSNLIRQRLSTELYFAKKAEALGLDLNEVRIMPATIRRKLWFVVQEMLAEAAEANDAAFVPIPTEVLDSEGFLKIEYSFGDITHANSDYARLLLRKMAGYL